MKAAQSIRLVPEHGAVPFSIVELEDGLSFLELPSLAWQLGAPPTHSAALLLEPMLGKPPRLLLVNRSELALRVNDRVAPSLAVLRERDQFRLGIGPAWQVAVFNRPRITAPVPESGVVQCAVCLNTLEPGRVCFWCPGCGAGMHLSSGDDAGAWSCAVEGENCLGCGRVISMREGYSREPDIDREN